MKRISAGALGILIGCSLTMSVPTLAASVKQYILTEVSYPLFVNGKEYKDAYAPILNYEGSTYVPLAKLGEIAGVNYKWNDALKRVEIVTNQEVDISKETIIVNRDINPNPNPAPNPNTTLKPGTKVVEPKGLVVENGETVFYAYDELGKYMGRFTDADDALQTWARSQGDIVGTEKVTSLPPTISEGWISDSLLVRIFKYKVSFENSNITVLNSSSKELIRLNLPGDWKDKTSGDTSSNNVKLKKYDKTTYFNIEDLRKSGIIG
jgi:hypothetical protein